jgi:phosphoribosyl 1,2-cyclic phosphate phosphodiesterase
VCRSEDSRDKRLRTSVFIESVETSIIIDTGPDFRQQMLRHNFHQLDAVLITHEHNDHIIGVDDIRPFNFAQGRDMPFYALPRVINELEKRFAYVFSQNAYPGAPRIQTIAIQPGQIINIGDLRIECLPITHGKLDILGFKINDFVYITDASEIDGEVIDKIRNCKVLVLNALHRRPHHSHFNLEQALHHAHLIEANQTYFTHLSHFMGLHKEVIEELPEKVSLAYDGLSVIVP